MLIAAITLLLLAAALLTRGLIGHRVGEEPRCRKCNYNLTGVESKKCPECGRAWTIESAPKGLRHRSKRLIALGAPLLLIGAALAVGTTTGYIQKANWFTHLPTSCVIPAAANGSTDAVSVLADRFANNRLSPTQLEQVIEAALVVQGDPKSRETTDLWMDLLVQMEARAQLSADQRDRYYRQMVQVEPQVPAKIRKNPVATDRMLVWLHKRIRAGTRPNFGWQANVDVVMADGRILAERQFVRDSAMSRLGGTQRLGHNRSEADLNLNLDVLGLDPGLHRVEFRMQTKITGLNANGVPPIWSGTQIAFAEFELLRSDAPDPIQLVSDEDTITRLRAALEFRATLIPRPGTRWAPLLNIEARVAERAPCDAVLAFTWDGRTGVKPFDRIDEERRIRVFEGSSSEAFTTHVINIAPNLTVGDTLTIRVESLPIGLDRGTGLRRLAGDIHFEPIRVVVQAGAALPPAPPGPRTPRPPRPALPAPNRPSQDLTRDDQDALANALAKRCSTPTTQPSITATSPAAMTIGGS